mmetsp:Transcript_40343/g.130109  ORF Transcript_40343/g.130109 Transcript_40343/m.130109 type:complete len:430 (+) Transcript_40343:99-1388(+)
MAAPSSLLRGELYKADQMGAIFKLRWVELWAGGKGELRWGYPGPNAGTTDRGISDLSGATVSLGAEEWRGAEARFGFQVTPRSRPRTYFFQASSAEERRLWVDAIENVASPDVTRSNLGGGYRLIFMVRPQYPRPWGIDLGSAPGLPCVTVLEVAGEEARAVGLLAGDVVLTLGNTVLRTATVAQRAFREAPYGRVTMRLVTHNREVCIMKHQSQQLFCSDPPAGVGAIITRFLDGSGVGGLNAGDRLLAVNGKLVTDGAEQLSRRLQDSAGEVKLVVSGYTTAHSLRKDEEGKLGVRLSDGPRHSPPVLSEVARSSSAWSAGLRAGDAVVGVSGEAVFDAEEAEQRIAAAGRSVNIVTWKSRPDMDGVAGAKERARGAPPRRPNVTASAAECYYLPHAWHKQELYHDLTLPTYDAAAAVPVGKVRLEG